MPPNYGRVKRVRVAYMRGLKENAERILGVAPNTPLIDLSKRLGANARLVREALIQLGRTDLVAQYDAWLTEYAKRIALRHKKGKKPNG